MRRSLRNRADDGTRHPSCRSRAPFAASPIATLPCGPRSSCGPRPSPVPPFLHPHSPWPSKPRKLRPLTARTPPNPIRWCTHHSPPPSCNQPTARYVLPNRTALHPCSPRDSVTRFALHCHAQHAMHRAEITPISGRAPTGPTQTQPPCQPNPHPRISPAASASACCLRPSLPPVPPLPTASHLAPATHSHA